MIANIINSDDEYEVNLQDAIWIILKHKKVVLLIPAIFAIALFFVSEYLIPPKYEAISQLVISESVISTELDNRIATFVQIPKTDSLTTISLAEDLLANVYQDPSVFQAIGDDYSFVDFKENVSVDVEVNVILLIVLDTDPQRAAMIANKWAEEATNRLNETFGVSERGYSNLEIELAKTKQDWIDTQAALDEYLPNSPLRALNPEIEQLDITIQQHSQIITDLNTLIGQAQGLDNRLGSFEAGGILETSDQLSLLGIELRASGSGDNFQLQFTDTNTLEKFTIEESRNRISVLISSLEAQRVNLQNELANEKSRIIQLNSELEKEKFKIRQLTEERDLALNAYQALSNQLVETRITLSQKFLPFKFVGRSLTPEEVVFPQPVLIAILGGISSLFLVIAYILFKSWLGKQVIPRTERLAK